MALGKNKNKGGDLTGSKRSKKARENATGKSTAQIQAYNAKVNSGNFKKNDHGLPDGGHMPRVAGVPAKQTAQKDAKFRRVGFNPAKPK